MHRFARTTFAFATTALIVVAAGTARAQDKPAATRPTSPPRIATTRLAGEENPKRALTVYAVAMASGDAAKVADAYYAESDDEKAVVAAYAHMASAVGALRKAATDKFGPDGFDNIGFGKMFTDQVKQLEQTRVFVEGDRALAFTDTKDNRPDLKLIRIETGWKISATSFTYPKRQAARIEAQAGAYDELAKEIEADKYRLATEAQLGGRKKVAEAKKAVEERLKKEAAAATTAAPATESDPATPTPPADQQK